jgi:ketosteroid isomerase-like protein
MDDYVAQKEVARANRSFYAAFEKLDLAAMIAVWSEAPADDAHIHCIHPGWEIVAGRERVLRSWELIFRNTASIAFDVADVAIDVRGDVALVTNVENIRTDARGQQFDSIAAATNVFVRRDGGWRMIVHHASPILHPGSSHVVEPQGGGDS